MNRLRAGMTLLAMLASILVRPAAAAIDPDLLHGLEARAIGPAAVGGRIAAIDAVAKDPNHVVIGAATGGVWVSDNGGVTWTPVFDEEAVASIGAVAINQDNPDLIWVGTGEGNTRNSTSIGGGVYKSLDGGKTWEYIGLAESERINRIALHPDNPDIAYVAALGTLWGPNEERGVYKTVDGGRNWQRILFVDENTGATDIKMDPSNPDKLFAGMWQFRRWPHHFKSGGPGSGMYVSFDGGRSWQQRTEEDGLPQGELGRMAFAIPAANPERVYALVEAQQSALIRSDDGGATWKTVNDSFDVADRPFYYMEVIADPRNPDRVYNMATRLRVSIDGGKTFTTNPVIDCCDPGNTIHIDNHAFWVNPQDPRHLIIGNDGGIAVSRDRGETWRFVRNLPLAQFYHIAVDDEVPYHVYGGLQDNGSWRGPSEVWLPAGIRNLHWQEVGFGDGFDTRPDPENALAGYAMSQGGMLFRYDLGTGQSRLIRPAPPQAGVDLRFNWDAALEQDPFDPATIYYGSQFVHKSTDRGETWTAISPDLTSNDPDLQTFRHSGGLTPDVTAAENYTTIVSIGASALERGLLWVGTDDGRVHVSRNGGGDWSRIDPLARGVEPGAWVPMISPSPHAADTAFVVFDDHRRSNMRPYVYRVSDYGRRWENLATNELDGYALSIVQDTVDSELLFLGTEFGLYITVDGGEHWIPFKAGVPTVSVMDLALQTRENDLVLGTHGRSVFIIDDYSGLRGLDEGRFEARLEILSATRGQHYYKNPTRSTRFTGSGEYRGENEPYGVMVTFIASGDDLPHPDAVQERARRIARRQAARASEPAGEAGDEDTAKDQAPKVTVAVRNDRDELVRTFREPLHQGINRLTWDMRIDGVRPAPGPEREPIDDGLPPGPEVLPGHYRVTLSFEEAEDSVEVVTLADPRSAISREQRQANFAARLELRDLERVLVAALERIDRVRSDVQTLTGLIVAQERNGRGENLDPLKQQADAVGRGLDELEQLFRTQPQTKGIVYDDDKVTARLTTARYFVASHPGAPTPTARLYIDQARSALEQASARLNGFMATDLAALREAVEAAGIGLLMPAGPVGLPE